MEENSKKAKKMDSQKWKIEISEKAVESKILVFYIEKLKNSDLNIFQISTISYNLHQNSQTNSWELRKIERFSEHGSEAGGLLDVGEPGIMSHDLIHLQHQLMQLVTRFRIVTQHSTQRVDVDGPAPTITPWIIPWIMIKLIYYYVRLDILYSTILIKLNWMEVQFPAKYRTQVRM